MLVMPIEGKINISTTARIGRFLPQLFPVLVTKDNALDNKPSRYNNTFTILECNDYKI